ncbi:HzsA-related protein [Pontiella sulfatireligans]|uniref:Cytochrome c domain-containing protein n=1 Tax=Pontiella sulfatireligans TaxID=2750658 RepID=A0A6C2UHI5_9BACT|nr:hypothetical protein [Pontiella sulfatireligans]VGO19655.1 hypothetical protein SCARR_01714 [Pontiella sulfatireligans]
MKSVLVGLLLLAVSGQAQPNSLESLREAVEFLSATYGDQYPNGEAYLNRLNGITNAASAEYVQLQREALLNHPHVKGYDWLVEVRSQYWGNHGPINTMFQNGDMHGSGYKNFWGQSARLEVISFKDGKSVRKSVLAEEPEGILRDADVRFDGKKILYSGRRNTDDDYHLYEMDIDGGNQTQLTFGSMIADVDPLYVPGDRIVFSSTRDPKFCQCNKHISNNMFAMDSDGANIEQISFNDLADFHSSLMQNGSLLYSRWEYVDRHFGPSLGLWTTNPDGTRHALYMGNNAWSPGFIGDAREIPGTGKVICIYGATHDLPWGAMAVVDRSRGLEGNAPILHMWPEEARELVSPDDDVYNRDLQYRKEVDKMRPLKVRYEDPYPVHDLMRGDGGGHFFFVSKTKGKATHSYANKKRKPMPMALMLCDVFGNELVAYELEDGPLSPYGAVPVAPRKTPPAIPSPVDHAKNSGFLYVNDCYLGNRAEMEHVEKGAIKYLRIVEAPPRRVYDEVGNWNVDAQQVGAMNWNLTNNKRILGDVPVEKDGSVYFEIPADTFIQFFAMDEDRQMIQAMRSGTVVRPGETQGCIGCHENRLSAPSATNPQPLAMRRAPSQLEPWLDTPSVEKATPFNYLTDVQPVFDKHCVSCHDYGKEAGEVLNLCGDLSLPFNVSYTELMAKSGHRYTGSEEKMVNFVGDGPPGVLPAYAWGSHRSKLVRVLKEGHHDMKLSKEEMQRITGWIDVNAVYYGRYESFYPGRNPLLALPDGKAKSKLVFNGREALNDMKNWVLDHGHLVNFTRPEKSPCLTQIEDAAQRGQALSYLKEANELLAQQPRIDQINAVVELSPMDKHYSDRYAATESEHEESVKAILKGKKHYQFKD